MSDPGSPTLPADLLAVQADDKLLDALRGSNLLGLHPEHPTAAANVTPDPENSDVRLTQMLVALRDDVDTEPAPQLVDVDTARTIVRARRSFAGRIVAAVRWLLGGVR